MVIVGAMMWQKGDSKGQSNTARQHGETPSHKALTCVAAATAWAAAAAALVTLSRLASSVDSTLPNERQQVRCGLQAPTIGVEFC